MVYCARPHCMVCNLVPYTAGISRYVTFVTIQSPPHTHTHPDCNAFSFGQEEGIDQLKMSYAAVCGNNQISKHTVIEFITYLVMKGVEPKIAEVSKHSK